MKGRSLLKLLVKMQVGCFGTLKLVGGGHGGVGKVHDGVVRDDV